MKGWKKHVTEAESWIQVTSTITAYNQPTTCKTIKSGNKIIFLSCHPMYPIPDTLSTENPKT